MEGNCEDGVLDKNDNVIYNNDDLLLMSVHYNTNVLDKNNDYDDVDKNSNVPDNNCVDYNDDILDKTDNLLDKNDDYVDKSGNVIDKNDDIVDNNCQKSKWDQDFS